MLPVLVSLLLLSAAPSPSAGLCVPMTDICAPPGADYEGLHQFFPGQDGVITLRAPVPLRALGVLFRAQTAVQVSVHRWGSETPGMPWAMVTVSGELDRPQVISGVLVAGTVSVGQNQSRRPWAAPQLLRGNAQAGTFTFFTSEQVTLSGLTHLEGSLETGGGRLQLSSSAPITVRKLTFAAGKLDLELGGMFWPGETRSRSSLLINGELAAPERVAGVDVKGGLRVAFSGKREKLSGGTLAAPTSLALLELPPGEAPAETRFSEGPGSSRLEGPSPISICGAVFSGQPGVTLQRDLDTHGLVVSGALVTPSAVVDGGPSMSGGVTLRLPARGCSALGLLGMVESGQTFEGVKLAARTVLDTQLSAGVETVQGTLAGPQTLDGRLLTGEFVAQRKPKGPLEVIKGTLAAPSRLGAWELPAGTHFRVEGMGFSFEVPPGTSAHAIGAHRGVTVDEVTSAIVDEELTQLSLATPWRQPGSELVFTSVVIEGVGHCVRGEVASDQQVGRLSAPAKSSVRLCGGALTDADGNGVTFVQFGRSFGTHLTTGRPGAPPRDDDFNTARAVGPGYWLQINSPCSVPSGIRAQQPPPKAWFYLDKTGEPTTPADRAELEARASQPGKPCPVMLTPPP